MLKTTKALLNVLQLETKISEPQTKNFYGLEMIIELFGCDLNVISSKEKIQEFIDGICKEIEMEKYGPSYIQRFPGGGLWGVGYSFFQFITTSSITGHFIENGGIAFLNVFSCNRYDDAKAAKFAKNFFRAQDCKTKSIIH